ncbi:PD-(D/E)XK motif protein [Methylorubrum extorquens]|uniref:PD-(D/E)XK motif protein n=1 Tax=Methylorubrum extorquens (strain ATCC 14718 / DSM 1338 / JCM 2805 / NCIMB 9133 / AM1) TaxID=272630 RepID=C5APE8_METEA|nr:conserved hypothetical protein [Methylorubrum extorquens AM1]
MNSLVLRRLFAQLAEKGVQPGAAFSGIPIPGARRHMAALSSHGNPGLLLQTVDGGARPRDIRLSGLRAAFGVSCSVAVGDEQPEERRISIIECLASPGLMPLFAESAGAFLRLLGEEPTMAEAADAVARFASIFSVATRSSSQSVTGLIGELMLLLLASNVEEAVSRWRGSPLDRFDFVGPDARLECKATSSMLRLHSFSWEQCNPPAGHALVASLRVEAAGGGMSVSELIGRIEARLFRCPAAAVRLRETVASTMGDSLPHALEVTFDEPLCRSSLQWFDLREIPAIRGDLPVGVSSLRFMSDVAQATAVLPCRLRGTSLRGLVPA